MQTLTNGIQNYEMRLLERISVRQTNGKHALVLTVLETSVQMRQVNQTCQQINKQRCIHELQPLCLSLKRLGRVLCVSVCIFYHVRV